MSSQCVLYWTWLVGRWSLVYGTCERLCELACEHLCEELSVRSVCVGIECGIVCGIVCERIECALYVRIYRKYCRRVGFCFMTS